MVLNLAQTVALVAAAFASVYVVVLSERNRTLDTRRARAERVLEAVLGLAEAAIRAQQLWRRARYSTSPISGSARCCRS